MEWPRKPEDYRYRWRKRFALFPMRVGERYIWLQRYAWRYLQEHEEPGYESPEERKARWARMSEEQKLAICQLHVYTNIGPCGSLRYWRVYELPNGYSCLNNKEYLSCIFGDDWRDINYHRKQTSEYSG